MGIPGLSTYINNNSHRYLEPCHLCNSYLVIDGYSLAIELYFLLKHSKSAFGGDYDKYAHWVTEYFDWLFKCNITPLVLLDGAYEDKKIKTIYSRLRSKVGEALNVHPSRKKKFLPLLITEVFIDVLKKMKIKYAQCSFEADHDIAAVARILRCPVLSCDSDFFVYDVLYIPLKTLEWGITNTKNGYVKRCKIFRLEKFLDSFGGLDKTLLPLFATVLGNDYIGRSVFDQFFKTLELSTITKNYENAQQKRIVMLLNWLRRHNLNSAIAGVLLTFQKEARPIRVEMIKMILDGYTNSSPHMLTALGFSKRHIATLKLQNPNHCFEIPEDLSSLETFAELSIKNDSEQSDTEGDFDEISVEDDDLNLSTKNILSQIAPSWFIEEFSKRKFPSYFVDMMYRQLYFCPPQVEDYFYPAAHSISLKIITVIFKLLTSTNHEEDKVLECVLRSEHNELANYRLENFPKKLPSLTNLNELPVAVKARIILETLNFSAEENINKIPPEWRLYVATISFWVEQKHEPLVTNCHILALLCAMLFHIVDRKIGFYRNKDAFMKRHCSNTGSVINAGKKLAIENQNLKVHQIKVAYDAVTKADCLEAAPFFISNFTTDPSIIRNPNVFNITTVHCFAQFQSCLKHSMDLNSLLGYPYLQPKVAELYNGTLMYNLYHNFQNCNDIETHLKVVLKNSPNLLQLLTLLSTFVRNLL